MTLKTYHGATMAEALANVKRDLGRGAVILQTRTFRKGGVLGFGGREVVEITASADVNVLPRTTPPARTPAAAARQQLARMFGQAPRPGEPAGPPARNATVGDADWHGHLATASLRPAHDSRAGRPCHETPPAPLPTPQSGRPVIESPVPDARASQLLRDEVAAIREMVSGLVRQNYSAQLGDMPRELFNAYLQLLEAEVAEEIARQVIESVRGQVSGESAQDRRTVGDAVIACISRMIPTAPPLALDATGRARVVALVGPTGVGKTTTIAKLAANYKLRENRRVGMITIDTYRIAAVSQLATYAQIIDVPLKVVLTPDELKAAMAELAGRCDVVLMDTAGRSPNDADKLNELRGFLAIAQPDETHLVLSSTSQPSVMKSAIQRFSPLGINRVILTKLDEAVSFGIILEVVRQVDAGLSYVTTGQDVPDDIEAGSAERLARWIVNKSLNQPEGEDNGRGDADARARGREGATEEGRMVEGRGSREVGITDQGAGSNQPTAPPSTFDLRPSSIEEPPALGTCPASSSAEEAAHA